MKTINIVESKIHLVIEIDDNKDVKLLHFSSLPFDKKLIKESQLNKFRIVEIQATGENQDENHGSKHVGTSPANKLKYKEHRDFSNKMGRKLEIIMENNGLEVIIHFQFINNIQAVKTFTELKNNSKNNIGIEYVSSFALTGIAKEGLKKWDEKSMLYIPHNAWVGECQWKKYSLPDLGLSKLNEYSLKKISFETTGTWSTSGYLPMGCFENTESGNILFWQIEHNGSWYWEISDIADHLYLQLSGPTENENSWWKNLKPGDSFVSVPVSIGSVNGNFEDAIEVLTKYRRVIRRKNNDNINLPIIFNDYMNCLFGDPTSENEIPLIDAAAKVGCEYYVIDCGWYSDGFWWDGVGEWFPSAKRFPNGIKEVLDYIKSKDMIPGLWLEIEVMGIKCRLADKVPDEWFFCRHGKRIIDHGRYQLDFRNPDVINHATGIVDRLVNEYGVGYIKMDYNINAGIGTEISSDSFGDGLLQHNRAYLDWIDNIFIKSPDLVIENCGSGGMRIDYALLSRHSIQSSSDQTDYKKYAVISGSIMSAVTPEQCAIWSYPLKDGDEEEVIFNMVNCMLGRIHQSGHLAEISKERLDLVKEGLDYYKKIRKDISIGLPFWPLGLPSFSDKWVAFGLDCGNKIYISVWRLENSSEYCIIPLDRLKKKTINIKCGYPQSTRYKFNWYKEAGQLSVRFYRENSARIFEINF